MTVANPKTFKFVILNPLNMSPIHWHLISSLDTIRLLLFFFWGNQHHATNAVDCTEPGIFFQADSCNVEHTMIIKSLASQNCLRSTSRNLVTLKCNTVSVVVTVADWGGENVLSLQYTGAVSGLSGRQRALQAADERDAHPRNTKTKAS